MQALYIYLGIYSISEKPELNVRVGVNYVYPTLSLSICFVGEDRNDWILVGWKVH